MRRGVFERGTTRSGLIGTTDRLISNIIVSIRSSHMLQDEFPEIKKKYWGQHMWARGYFCGTVGAVDEETIKKYVEDQGKEEEKNYTIVDE